MKLVTAWGAPADDLCRAASGLRAIASTHQVTLLPVDQVGRCDLAAAVAGAHLLCVALRIERLSALTAPAAGAAPALSRVLLRSAGHPVPADLEFDLEHGVAPDLWLASAVDGTAAWLGQHVPDELDRAFASVASDLAAAPCRAAAAAAAAVAALVTDPSWHLPAASG